MKRIRVLLADDHRVLCDSVAALLRGEEDMEVVGQAADGEQALVELERLQPDVAVVDIGMPGMTGLEVARRVRVQRIPTAVVLLSQHDDVSFVREALDAGVACYVLKQEAARELVKAIRIAATGGGYFSPPIARAMATELRGPARKEPELTPREREVLRLVAEGLSSKEIATRLSIAPRTVEGFRTHIMHKLGIHDLAGLVKYAIGHRIVALDDQ